MIILLSLGTESIHRDDAELEMLISKTAEGDNDAFSLLFEKTKASVYGFSLSMLKNSHDAQDVLQSCFVKIYTASGSYKPKGKPMAWILTIAKNLCRDLLSERTETDEMPENDILFSADEPNEDRIFIEECLGILDDTEKVILTLHAVSGFKHRETAQLLGLPVGTVLSKYNRAIKKIQENFKGGYDSDGKRNKQKTEQSC